MQLAWFRGGVGEGQRAWQTTIDWHFLVILVVIYKSSVSSRYPKLRLTYKFAQFAWPHHGHLDCIMLSDSMAHIIISCISHALHWYTATVHVACDIATALPAISIDLYLSTQPLGMWSLCDVSWCHRAAPPPPPQKTKTKLIKNKRGHWKLP